MLNAPDLGVAAVVVGMRNDDPKRSVVWAPIDVRLQDASGAVIAENNVDGANPTLVRVPSLPAMGQAFYVNDQLVPDPPEAEPAEAEVVLGGDMRPLDPPPAALETRNVELVADPDLGASFEGQVVNTSPVRQEQLIVQAIVRRGTEIVRGRHRHRRGPRAWRDRRLHGLLRRRSHGRRARGRRAAVELAGRRGRGPARGRGRAGRRDGRGGVAVARRYACGSSPLGGAGASPASMR